MLVEYTADIGCIWRRNVCSGAFIHSPAISSSLTERPLRHRAQWDREIKCPSDGTEMRGLRRRNVTVDICPVCHSVWLDGDEIQKVLGRPLPGDSTFDLQKSLQTIASFMLDAMSFDVRRVP